MSVAKVMNLIKLYTCDVMNIIILSINIICTKAIYVCNELQGITSCDNEGTNFVRHHRASIYNMGILK